MNTLCRPVRFAGVCALLALVPLLGGVCRADAPRGRALIVGVNNYLDPNITGLKYSVPDSKLIADILTDPDRSIFPKENVRLLTDDAATEEGKPNRLNILEGIQWLSEAGPDETVLFYFAGHGVVSEGKQYLACRDVKLNALAFTAVPIDDVNNILDDPAKTKARQIVVVFDSCHSGTRRGARSLDSESGAVIEKLMSQASGRVTLASSQPEESSFEDPDKGHGIFTYFLSEGLKGAADQNHDGLVDVTEAYNYAYKNVTTWAKAQGNHQTPKMASNVSGTVFLTKDPVVWAKNNQERASEVQALQQLRDKVTLRLGSGPNDLTSDDGAAILGGLDRLAANNAQDTDARVQNLATKYVAGDMTAEALRAELKVMGAGAHRAGRDPAGAALKIEMFQPQWQPGDSEDELVVHCRPGENVKVVGLAASPKNIARVVLNGQSLKLTSLGRDLQLVPKAEPGTNMRFEGDLQAGAAPSAAVLSVVDVAGNRRLMVLHLLTEGAPLAPPLSVNTGPVPITAMLADTSRKVTVAVVGLNKRNVDDYEDLHALRVGQGLHNQLTRATRDTGRFTLVEEKSEVVRGLVEMQWIQKRNVEAFDQTTAVAAGKLMGAKYVLYGEVYDFASPKENKGKLMIAVEIRLVDVETARFVPGYGQGELLVPKGEPGELDFDRSSLGKVCDMAIHNALADIFRAANQVLPPAPAPAPNLVVNPAV